VTDEACIVGIGETAYVRKPGSGLSQLGLQLKAAVRAIEDAGLTGRQVDGIMPFPNLGHAESFAANLGGENRRFQSIVWMGGAAPVASLRVAAAAVKRGLADHVLIPAGWNGYSGARARQTVAEDVSSLPGGAISRDFYLPFGFTAPPQWYSVIARRHMHEFGTQPEQLGCIAVAMRKHAQRNPNAVMSGRPLTLEDYLASPMLADPYRLFDCCLETDGAAAVVVTTPERARDLGKEPVFIMGAASGQPCFGQAGISPRDVDFAQIYDCFTFEVLQQLEEAGFCKRGEGGAFVEGGRIELGGELPVNTHGGLLSEAHVLGMNHVVEAVRQLRGDAGERQVAGAEIGVVTGWGDFGDGSIAILRRA
jgi:acetyl-CoA acetyltransferase